MSNAFKKAVSAALFPVLCIGLFACNSNLPGEQSQVELDPEVSMTDASETEDATYGGDAVVGITQEPSSFDPHAAVAAGDKELAAASFKEAASYLAKTGAKGVYHKNTVAHKISNLQKAVNTLN